MPHGCASFGIVRYGVHFRAFGYAGAGAVARTAGTIGQQVPIGMLGRIRAVGGTIGFGAPSYLSKAALDRNQRGRK